MFVATDINIFKMRKLDNAEYWLFTKRFMFTLLMPPLFLADFF